MNKKDLIDSIAKKTDMTKKDSAAALNATIEAIQAALSKGDSVGLVGFGTFLVKKRKARSGVNPRRSRASQRRRRSK